MELCPCLLYTSAKQRLKVYYGNISEKQFHKYYVEAIRRKGDTAENLIGLLESRLDNLVYKAKFVPTVFAARQFVNHGHVTVNGKKVNIPSYQLKAGDVIEAVSYTHLSRDWTSARRFCLRELKSARFRKSAYRRTCIRCSS